MWLTSLLEYLLCVIVLYNCSTSTDNTSFNNLCGLQLKDSTQQHDLTTKLNNILIVFCHLSLTLITSINISKHRYTSPMHNPCFNVGVK